MIFERPRYKLNCRLDEDMTNVIFRGLGEESDNSGLSKVSHGKMSNIQVFDSILFPQSDAIHGLGTN